MWALERTQNAMAQMAFFAGRGRRVLPRRVATSTHGGTEAASAAATPRRQPLLAHR